ncbi:MAG TPA: cysteine peptidase family C39 domain-containing protein [Kofleriaceae bacterium]|nr:cysteine peptidase family C39 domain-containing protein [Kofleriaceae bacterium]
MRRALRPAARCAVALVALALAGCIRFPSTARAARPEAISPARGWISVRAVEPVRQESARDCGPAAIAMVVRFWGVPLRLADATRAALLAGSDRGSTLGALRDVARARGLTAFAIRADRATLQHELERGRPVVVGLLRARGDRRLSHYEVVVGIRPDSGDVATIDPAAGLGIRRWSQLAAEWDPAGRPALVVIGRAGRTARASHGQELEGVVPRAGRDAVEHPDDAHGLEVAR